MRMQLEQTFSRCKMHRLRDDGYRASQSPYGIQHETNDSLFVVGGPARLKKTLFQAFLRHKIACMSAGPPNFRQTWKPGGPFFLLLMNIIGYLVYHVTVA